VSRYRNVHCLIWNDDKFPFASDDCQLVFFHLLTTPFGTPFGLFKASLSMLADEKRWTKTRYEKAFREGIGKGFFKYDERHLVVLIPKFVKYNQPQSANVITAWKKIIDELPPSPLKTEWIQIVKGLLVGFHKAFTEAFEKACLIQEQEQEQEQEQDKDTGADPLKPFADVKDKQPVKKLYLDNVMLTDDEYTKLIVKFGETGAKSWIEEINIARGLNTSAFDKKYHSHYMTILSWYKFREKKNPTPPEPPGGKKSPKPEYYRDSKNQLRSLSTHELVKDIDQGKSSEPVNLEGISNVRQLVVAAVRGMAL
jgi:hypothetical protein